MLSAIKTFCESINCDLEQQNNKKLDDSAKLEREDEIGDAKHDIEQEIVKLENEKMRIAKKNANLFNQSSDYKIFREM